MAQLMGFLSFLVSIYMMIVFLRIILTWFSWMGRGKFQDMLARITDPYLNWFRRFPLRVGFLDLSPIVALTALSLINRIFAEIASRGTISIGIILSLVLEMFWAAASFLFVLLIIVFILRLIAHFARFDTYNQFWRIVDAIFQAVSYRINRVLLRDRIVNFTTSIIISVLSIVLAYIVLRLFVAFLSRMLASLPI